MNGLENRVLDDDFYLALGRLQESYASLEVDLACAIRNFALSGYHHPNHAPLFNKVTALLGGFRIDGSKDTFKRLLRVTDTPHEVQTYVSDIFKHLGELQFLRNRLSHYLTFNYKGRDTDFDYLNTDMDVAKESEKAISIGFSLEAIVAATEDLEAIPGLLWDALPSEDDPSYNLVQPTWQYKPSMLTR